MSWNFVLTDSRFTTVGEILNASDRQVSLPLNKLDTLSFRIRTDNPLAASILTTNCYIKAYRNRQLRFFGPVVTIEESAERDSQSIAVNAVGAGWVLQRRLAGKSILGHQFTSLTDRAEIASQLIETANVESETGIRRGTNTSASLITYTAGPYRPILDIINELAASVDGFDWRIFPEEFSGGKYARFYASPVIGDTKQGAIFEYGTGRHNVESYKLTINRGTMANQVFHVSQGAESGSTPVVTARDAGSIATWMMVEDMVQADLTDPVLRQSLVNEHVAVRRAPRQVVEFTPHIDPENTGRLPRFGDDFDVGDWVVARAVIASTSPPVTRFNAMFRVWGVNFAIDPHGVERMTLVLVDNQ